MGNLLRYLKCCKWDPFGNPTPYPRLSKPEAGVTLVTS